MLFNSDTRYGRRVPRGHVWLEGDNKMCSLDSRNYGPVPAGLITSVLRYKVMIRNKLNKNRAQICKRLLEAPVV